MRKFAWLLPLAILAALALLLSACSGQPAPPTPLTTINPSSLPMPSPTATMPPVLINGVPAIPHPTTGYEDCLACHKTGVAGTPIIPADHAGRTNATCKLCHQEETATSTATSSNGTTTGTSTPTPTSTQTTTTVPEIPHTLVGRSDCLACHQTGGGGAPAVPADHAGRTDSMCLICHHQAPSATSTATATPTTTAAPTTTTTATPTTTAPATTTTTTPTTTAASGTPPHIPHYTAGFTSCLTCHQTGIGGAPEIPADHAGRTDSMCTLCHTPAATQITLSYPTIPHTLTGRSDCLMCHKTGLAGAPEIPANHAGRTDDMCPVCHHPASDS